MATKVFIIGGVGSGKSTIKRQISDRIKDRGVPHHHFDAYSILKDLRQEDKDNTRSRPLIENGKTLGFLVTDFSMYEDCRFRLGERIKEKDTDQGIITVELVAMDYAEVFRGLQRVHPNLLSEAHFLFISTPLEKRIAHIQKRNISPGEDSPFLSEELVKRFEDDGEWYIRSAFKTDFGVTDNRVQIIENTSDLFTFQGMGKLYAERTLLPSVGIEAQISYPNREAGG